MKRTIIQQSLYNNQNVENVIFITSKISSSLKRVAFIFSEQTIHTADFLESVLLAECVQRDR